MPGAEESPRKSPEGVFSPEVLARTFAERFGDAFQEVKKSPFDSYEKWKKETKDLFLLFDALDDAGKKSLYTWAQKAAIPSELAPLLSHPNYEVFKAVISQPTTREAVLPGIYLALIKGKDKAAISQKEWETFRTQHLGAFAEEYGGILEQAFPEDTFFLLNNNELHSLSDDMVSSLHETEVQKHKEKLAYIVAVELLQKKGAREVLQRLRTESSLAFLQILDNIPFIDKLPTDVIDGIVKAVLPPPQSPFEAARVQTAQSLAEGLTSELYTSINVDGVSVESKNRGSAMFGSPQELLSQFSYLEAWPSLHSIRTPRDLPSHMRLSPKRSEVKFVPELGKVVNESITTRLAPQLNKLSKEAQKQLFESPKGEVPVGLKIHFSSQEAFENLRRLLTKYEVGMFKAHNAVGTLILPPFGSTTRLVDFVRSLERSGVTLFESNEATLQLCFPVELSGKYAAILGLAYVAGTGYPKKYEQDFFSVNMASHYQKIYVPWRPLIRGAGKVWKSGFSTLLRDLDGKRSTEKGVPSGLMPSTEASNANQLRTDVLGVRSAAEIDTLTLVATLVSAAEYMPLRKEGKDGTSVRHLYWHSLGVQFVRDVEILTRKFNLDDTLAAHWVWPDSDGYPPFSDMFEKLTTRLEQDVNIVQEERRQEGQISNRNVFWLEFQDLIAWYRKEMDRQVAEFSKTEYPNDDE